MAKEELGFGKEFVENYFDPEDVDLPDDHPLVQMFERQRVGRRLALEVERRPFDPKAPPTELRQVRLDDGSYAVIEVGIGGG